jgi:hypothetical protein
MGSAKNYKKEYVRWYKEIFVPACAAYAVAYDWTDQAYILENAPKKEAEFKFDNPGITNAVFTTKKLKQARDASLHLATATSAAGLKSSFKNHLEKKGAADKSKYLTGDKVILHGKEYSIAEFKTKADKLQQSTNATGSGDVYDDAYVAAAQDQSYRLEFRKSKIALENVFNAITQCPGPGDEPWKLGIWTTAQKFKFFNIADTPDPDLFNAIISTSQTNHESPNSGHPTEPMDPGGSVVNTTKAMKTFPGFFAAPGAEAGDGLSHTPITFYRPYGGKSGKSPLGEVPDLIEVDSGDVPKLTTEQVARETKTHQWKMNTGKTFTQADVVRANSTTTEKLPLPAPGLSVDRTSVFTAERLGKLWEAFSIPAVTRLLGAGTIALLGDLPAVKGWEGVYYAKRERLFDEFQKMVIAIGKSKFKARQQPRGAPGGLSHYDKILYTVLYGLQEPPPPPLPGNTPAASAPSERLPQTGTKRALRRGEVHAIELQCFLLENIKQLASIREKLNYKHLGKISDAMPGNIVSKLNHGSPLPNEPPVGSWPPAGGPDQEAYWLQNMCPDLWALMTPHIEIYRVDYDKENAGNLISTGELRIPFKNFVDKEDINEITDGKYGRVGGAGIKSFSWSLDGVQPAEVDNMISAKLVIHFQSVYDLFRHNKVTDKASDDEYAAGIIGKAGYLDLIIGSGTSVLDKPKQPEEKTGQQEDACGSLHQGYDGARFRIKAIVGWATPPNFKDLQIPGYSPVQLEAIAKAITNSRTALYLQIVSHAINFQQDGTLELDIDYQASISGIMRSADADIFIAKEIHAQAIKDIQKDLDDPAVAQEHSTTHGTAKGKAKEEKRTELLKEQIELMRQNRMHKYSIFLKELQKKNKVYGVRVPSETLLNPIRKMDSEDRLKAAKTRQSQDISKLVVSGKAAKKSAAEAEKEAADLIEALKKAETDDAPKSDPTQNTKLKGMADEVGIFNTGNQDTVLVPYFYLGDLIDVLFETRLAHLAQKDGPKKSSPMQMVLGTVELVDPLAAFQIQSVAVECPGKSATVYRRLSEIDPLRFKKITGITTFMNIGSIPISIDKFNEWFLNKVMRSKKDSYFLLNFIKDICADLISAAYGETCFEDVFKFNIRFDTASFRLAPPTVMGKKDLTIDQLGQSIRKGKALDKMRLTKDSKQGACIPTVLIYSVDSRPMSADRMSDMSEGIYHYFLGGRCGLAKEIQFNRQDMPYYREARISKDASLGAQQLKELYTVNMNMVGNNLHKNGTYVYIDPIAIGAGSSRAVGGIPNIARLIGLGGYFLVTGVKHDVSDTGFNTTVDAIQQASNFDDGANEKITGLAAPVPKKDPPLDKDPDAENYDPGQIQTDDPDAASTGPGSDKVLEKPYETRKEEPMSEERKAELADLHESGGLLSAFEARKEIELRSRGMTSKEARAATLAKRQERKEMIAAQEAEYKAEDERRAAAGEPSQYEEEEAAQRAFDAEEGF